MNETDMQNATDEQLLKELRGSLADAPESVALQMAIALRNTSRLTEAIVKASRTGQWLSWVIVGATVVSTIVAVMQFIYKP